MHFSHIFWCKLAAIDILCVRTFYPSRDKKRNNRINSYLLILTSNFEFSLLFHIFLFCIPRILPFYSPSFRCPNDIHIHICAINWPYGRQYLFILFIFIFLKPRWLCVRHTNHTCTRTHIQKGHIYRNRHTHTYAH